MSLLMSLCGALLFPFFSGAASVALFGRRTRQNVPGLLFHSVSEVNPYTLSSLSTTCFKNIVSMFHRNGFQGTTLDHVASGATLPRNPSGRNPLLLTFDDGCRSFHTTVLGTLEKFSFKATVFPVAGFLGKSSTWDVYPSFKHLSKSELAEISLLGHQVGSHGLTHADLTKLSLADLTAELSDSKKILEDASGKTVCALSFPFGSWNRHVWDVAREVGYTSATIYRKHSHLLPPELFPVFGTYSFDTPQSVFARVAGRSAFAVAVACARIMCHFAKGTPLWKFRRNYRLLQPVLSRTDRR